MKYREGLMIKKDQEDFGKALANKDFEKAWETANSLWYGSTRMQRVVLYEMLSTLLKMANGEKQQ
jgi:hypothetical protein